MGEKQNEVFESASIPRSVAKMAIPLIIILHW